MKFSKKILIILPVLIVSLFYLEELYEETYSRSSFKRVAGFIASVLLLYGWIILFAVKRKQASLADAIIHGSFFIYVFAVLQLTGYFILFKEISSHGWWDKMDGRIQSRDHVNLTPFKTMAIYATFDRQIAGNFVMLLPLGIYLPLLFKRFRKISGIFAVLLISFLVSLAIELLQLATSYRSTDIDDIILNSLGACTGFIIYQLIKSVVGESKQRDH